MPWKFRPSRESREVGLSLLSKLQGTSSDWCSHQCAWYKFFPTEAKELHRPRYHCRKDFFILQPASAHLTKAHGLAARKPRRFKLLNLLDSLWRFQGQA
ncbi:hypothetical protein WJX84_001043 [Apatococcus fuscideae]|uniref:Uncharacterized protein n=1 Tax=Apatococcus fuscideae TaxID=2026836 RepID=A0AAW1TLF7_9CHLO